MTVNCEYQFLQLVASPKEMAQDRVTRKWEVFAGRNRFYCDGRLMTAPHSGVFILTICLITGTSTLFFIFDCQYLAENVTIAIPIIGALLFIFTISSLLRTSLSDPGIIPRATVDEAAYVEKQIEVTNSANSPTYRPPPRTKEVLVKGQTVKLKYCFTCKIFRPPRASHCSLCDNCVDRFDHHCPWVGNCVGRRNYRFFYMFIVSLAFLAVFIFACAVAHLILITNENKFLDAVKESPASVVVAIICFFSVWSILGLAGFHTYLTTSNQTTNEDIKGSFTSKRGQESFNPYSQGNVCLNCFHILCGPVTPSLIDRRGIVTRSEETRIPVTYETAPPLKYGTLQNGSSQTSLPTDMPGIYRQTTEISGTFKQMVPSKKCNSNKRISPSHSLPRHLERETYDQTRFITPLPNDYVEEEPDEFNYKQYYASIHSQPLVRQYTPPEKRYSASFGHRLPERKHNANKTKPTKYIYENIDAERDFCLNEECYVNQATGGRNVQNVMVNNCPLPEFNQLYIQENFE